MKMVRCYLPPLISVLAVIAYFAPWYGNPRANLGYYVFAFLWFLLAWIAIPVNLIIMILCIRNHDNNWIHNLIAVIIVIGCYIGVFIGMVNGYMVTV